MAERDDLIDLLFSLGNLDVVEPRLDALHARVEAEAVREVQRDRMRLGRLHRSGRFRLPSAGAVLATVSVVVSVGVAVVAIALLSGRRAPAQSTAVQRGNATTPAAAHQAAAGRRRTERAAAKADRLVIPRRSLAGVSTALVRNFAVLRRPASVARAASGGLVPVWLADSRRNHQFGLDPAAAVEAVINGQAFWFVPGAANVCIATTWADDPPGVSFGSGGCGSVNSADDGSMMAWHLAQTTGTVTIWGLAPDPNSTVTVTLANGSRRTVPVINNFYSLTTGPGPTVYRSLSIRDASGAQRTYSRSRPAIRR